MLLEGIFLPLTTPFHPDGRLFLYKLALNVEHYSRTQAAGMLVLGREGEGDALTDDETVEVLRSAIAAAADEKVMIANVGRESVSATLALVKHAADAGYDAIAVRPPWRWSAGMEWEMGIYFRTIADRSPLPIVIVNDLERYVYPKFMRDLAQHPQIIGAIHMERSLPPDGLIGAYSPQHRSLEGLLRFTETVGREVTVTSTFAAVTRRMIRETESSANFVPAASLGGTSTTVAPAMPSLKTRSKRVSFQILASSSRTMLDTWKMGAVGAIPPLAACAPQACCEVWQAFKDGDAPLAAEKQARIRAAAELVEGRGFLDEPVSFRRGIAALKYGCDLNAYFGGQPRLPLLPLTAEQREAVQQALAGMKN